MDILTDLKNKYLVGPPHHQKDWEKQIGGLPGQRQHEFSIFSSFFKNFCVFV